MNYSVSFHLHFDSLKGGLWGERYRRWRNGEDKTACGDLWDFDILIRKKFVPDICSKGTRFSRGNDDHLPHSPWTDSKAMDPGPRGKRVGRKMKKKIDHHFMPSAVGSCDPVQTDKRSRQDADSVLVRRIRFWGTGPRVGCTS